MSRSPIDRRAFMATIPRYWNPWFRAWKIRLGDPDTKEGGALLTDRSPLNHLERATKPILIAQGLQDVRVVAAESEQMVAALQKRDVSVTYVIFADEGHGFVRPENQLAFYAVAEAFLAKHLGGRAQPVEGDFAGSSIQVPTGARSGAGIARLTVSEVFDLLIVGGGINGVGIARDAAGRGLKVLLCEKGDLAGATSSASSKMIHGGLRYLEHGAFRLVRESLAEREVLLKIAPHLVRPMRFVLPHGPGLRLRGMLRLGLFLYDRLGGARSLPASEAVDLRAGPMAAPLQDRVTRGFVYSDCVVDDARLTVANARDAAQHGAAILTRTTLSGSAA